MQSVNQNVWFKRQKNQCQNTHKSKRPERVHLMSPGCCLSHRWYITVEIIVFNLNLFIRFFHKTYLHTHALRDVFMHLRKISFKKKTINKSRKSMMYTTVHPQRVQTEKQSSEALRGSFYLDVSIVARLAVSVSHCPGCLSFIWQDTWGLLSRLVQPTCPWPDHTQTLQKCLIK